MEQPYWCTTAVHQHGGIIFNLLWLSRRLIICIEEISIYMSTFPSTLTSKMAKYPKIRIRFLTRTAITLKFKLRWFPEEAGYSAEKGYTDINLPPLMRIKTLVAL